MGLKYFFIAFLISLPFWWGINLLEKNLEDFLFWKEMTENPQILTAQINLEVLEEQLKSLKPLRNWQVEGLKIEAKSAISVTLDQKGGQKVLFEKEGDKKLPIASLTKLMTAYVALENFDLNQTIEISKEAVAKEGEFGELKISEIFRVKALLYPLLMESSNDAALAFSELIGEQAFVELMNLEAQNLGLKNTYFVNLTGLDYNPPTTLQPKPTNPKKEIPAALNYSTAEDLVKFTDHLLKNQPLIWEILSTPEFDLYSPDGVFHHKVINTNELLEEIPLVVGGKTGETPKAKGCLLLVLKASKTNGYSINVILGSEDRFGEMRKLIDWINQAYKW